MPFFKKKNKESKPFQWKIKKKCLDLILESSKSIHPKEFGGLLRVDEKNKNVISEIVLLPGTVFGESHAIFKLHMQPIDFSVVGTVHSHPGPNAIPSNADLQLFRKHGKIHIIAAVPFNDTSWKAYNYNGKETYIEVV
jgi:proteasome lid subunit RPN8/RPN11